MKFYKQSILNMFFILFFVSFFCIISALITNFTSGKLFDIDKKTSCYKKWEHSNMESKYEKDSGCLIKMKYSDYWIPDNNYLVIGVDE